MRQIEQTVTTGAGLAATTHGGGALVAQTNPVLPAAGAESAVDPVRQSDVSLVMPLVEKYLVPAVAALLLLLVAWFVARFLARIASAPIRKRVDETLGRFAGNVVFYAVMIFAVLGVLGMFGVSVASFAAVLASAGFAIGLAFQGSLSNFAAGVLLLVLRPFKVGDLIEAAGVTATVFEIDLFTTTLDTPDNRRVIVPNSAVLNGNIENSSWHDVRRVEVAVGVAYEADLQQTRQALQAAADSLADFVVTGEGRGTWILLNELGDSSVNWRVRLWTRSTDYWSVREQLTAAVKQSLDQHGIAIPFPQLDVHWSGAGSAGL